MTKSERARARRADLLALLGGRCAFCRATEDLEIDHMNGRNWSPSKMSSHTRVNRYWKEFESGTPLRVLCRSCNAGYNPYFEEAPF